MSTPDTAAPVTETTPTETPAGDKPTTPAPSKFEQDRERALAEIGEKDRAHKESVRAHEADLAELARLRELDKLIETGGAPAYLRKRLGEKYTEDVLVDLADDLSPRKDKPVKDQVAEELTRREQEAAERKKTEEAAAGAKLQEEAEAELETFIGRSAEFRKEHAAEFPMSSRPLEGRKKVLRDARYNELIGEWCEKHGTAPQPSDLFPLLEAELRSDAEEAARAAGLVRAAPSLEDDVLPTERRRPEPTVTVINGGAGGGPMTAAQRAAADLEAYDREQQQRIRYGVRGR